MAAYTRLPLGFYVLHVLLCGAVLRTSNQDWKGASECGILDRSLLRCWVTVDIVRKFLEVQWLGLGSLTGCKVQSLVGELRSCKPYHTAQNRTTGTLRFLGLALGRGWGVMVMKKAEMEKMRKCLEL